MFYLQFLLQPEIDVGLSVNEPLLDVTQLNAGNLMTVTMETLFAPPESWTLTGTQYAFAATLPVPVTGEVSYVFMNYYYLSRCMTKPTK